MNTESVEPHVHRIIPQLSLLNVVSITVGSIIGSGIFISPKGVLQNVGSVGVAYFVWLVCGIISFFSNLCFVELALAMPKFGGEYVYIREMYTNFLAFVYQWLSMTVMVPSSIAIVSITCSEYILQPLFSTCLIPSLCRNIVALICIMLATYLNAVSVRASTRLVNILLITKFMAVGLIILTGFSYIFIYDDVKSFDNSFDKVKWSNLGLAYYAASWSYSGGDSIMSMTEEFRNPKRDFPRGSVISFGLIICVYLLANVAYLIVLTPEEMLLSNAVAVTFAEKSLGIFKWIIPVFVALSTFGGVTVTLLSSTRGYYAGARDGNLPSVIALISVKSKTPVGSIIITGIISMAYLFVDDIWALLNYFGFVTSCCDVLALSTLVTMRWFRPDIHKPFMVPILLPFIVMATMIGAVIMGAISSPIDALVGLALTLTVVPVYLLCVYPRTKMKLAGKVSRYITITVQKLTVSAPEEKRE